MAGYCLVVEVYGEKSCYNDFVKWCISRGVDFELDERRGTLCRNSTMVQKLGLIDPFHGYITILSFNGLAGINSLLTDFEATGMDVILSIIM